MSALFTPHPNVRKIGNGFVVTGHVERDGGYSEFPEEYFPDLQALDMAISERLSDTESRAASIEAPEPGATSFGPFWRLGGMS